MKVIIIEDEPITRMDVRYILEDAGIEILGEGKDGFDAINMCKELHPDMVVMDINMPNLDGISASKIIHQNNLCKGVVLLTAYSDDKNIEGASNAGVYGYLVKPVDEKNLVSTLKVAYKKALASEDIEKKLDEATKKLEDRKIIERAKGIIMQREGISEDEAYKKLRKLSMEKGCSLRTISEFLILKKD